MEKRTNREDRKKIIKDLQILAEDVYKLKQERRQKRPIVIEFSGSTKAGKTSCITSLELFLRRNGFSVKIVHERASLCPVSDKQSPMFNTWTASTSLAGMIGVLKDKNSRVDVLILDRGIFDSLCWFQWLASTGKMEKKQQQITENYYLMNEFVKNIDIVFAFCAKPEVSIDREYAHLLTEIEGTIMKESVLKKYIEAIKVVQKEKGNHFHKIFTIDTSDKDQNAVGKEVTEITLKTIKDVLMERIGYIDANSNFMKQLQEKKISYINNDIVQYPSIQFDLREQVESNNDLVQPIPIAVITNADETKVLVIRKRKESVSQESPEKDKVLPYVGGHTRKEDYNELSASDFIGVCRETLKREVNEEIGISIAVDDIKPTYIYTPNTQVSSKHFAVCFKVPIDEKTTKLSLDKNELMMSKGKSISGKFIELNKLPLEKFETWGLSIMRHYFGMDVNTLEQLTIFDYPEIEI